MKDYSRIQRYKSLLACQQRIDFNVRNARVFHYQFTEADQQLFQLFQINRLAPANAF